LSVPGEGPRPGGPTFGRTGGALTVGAFTVQRLAEGHGTPLYVYDAAAMRGQLAALRAQLPDVISVYYSVKANPNPAVIRSLVEAGAGCEIASAAEYLRARAAGCPPESILFAGPGKGEEELAHVLAAGIGEIHVESTEEIAMLGSIAARLGVPVDVSIRVNPAQSAAGGAMQMGGLPAAFGIDEERLEDAVATVKATPGLRLRGLHMFAGTQILEAEVLVRQWRHAVALAARLAEIVGTPPDTVDLGGGLGIPYFPHEKPLDLTRVRELAGELFASLPACLAGTRFVLEPGRYLVGPCGLYLARVRSVKRSRGTTFVILDGGMHHHLAASGNLGQVIKRDYPIVNASRLDDEASLTAVVVGPLCTPLDTLGRKAQLPAATAVGDLVAVLQSGAYGLSASPVGFLSHPMPAEVLVDGGRATRVRERGSFEHPLVALP
jgi:diaminopimelate decarboxylase